ncbi:MAG: LysR family substrate-binding domain-containing protein [Vicinamibacteraceae bacterium]
MALPEGHRYATAPLADLRQLAEENFVMCRRYADSGYRELVEDICREAGFTPHVLQAVEQKQTLLDLVAQGLGVSIVQASAAEQATGIRYQPFPHPVPHVSTALVWRGDARADLIASLVEIAERQAAQQTSRRLAAMERAALRLTARP